MAKDDYYVIAAKILVQLYKKLKCKKYDEDYFVAMSKQFPICEDYLNEIFSMLEEDGYIKGRIFRAWGGDIACIDYDSFKITVKGIDFLRDNSSIRKVCETLKEAASIYSIFQ